MKAAGGFVPGKWLETADVSKTAAWMSCHSLEDLGCQVSKQLIGEAPRGSSIRSLRSQPTSATQDGGWPRNAEREHDKRTHASWPAAVLVHALTASISQSCGWTDNEQGSLCGYTCHVQVFFDVGHDWHSREVPKCLP